MDNKNIAIDGPSGAGKSTTARSVAKRLGFIYVDTGALYRAIGLYVLKHGGNTKNDNTVSSLLNNITLELRYDSDSTQRIILNGNDVSDDIRSPDVSIAASEVSALPCVRSFLLDLQRNIAKKNSVVMDGRDIGTVVLPDAKVKIFLTASPETRADRRCKELLEKGIKTDYESVIHDILERDKNDSSRDLSPLRQADDAVLLDTSDLTFDESVNCVVRIWEERCVNGLE